jgi:uncharacterized protein YegJ (DUF2314 family)
MSRLLTLLILSAALLASGCDTGSTGEAQVTRRPDDPDIIHIGDDDPGMLAATKKARSTVSEFVKALAAPKPIQTAFAVKLRVSDGTNTEYMWITDISFDGRAFRGRLGNRPYAVAGVTESDELSVEAGEISDWMYVEDGRLVGGYTMRVLRNSVSPEARARLDAQAPFRFE